MHRKTTSRRENKRLDSKKVRAAEKAALQGGPIKTVRTDHWAARDDRQPPILDHPSTGKSRKKEKEIKYCPAREGRKRHHYLEGEEEVPTWPFWWEVDPPRKPYMTTRHYKICAYCGQTGRPHRRHFHSYRWHKSTRHVHVV